MVNSKVAFGSKTEKKKAIKESLSIDEVFARTSPFYNPASNEPLCTHTLSVARERFALFLICWVNEDLDKFLD